MKIISFNVNSVRQRLHQLEQLIATHDPDVIGLQETKVSDPEFPHEAIEALGYQASVFGQKTHYGVALLYKTPPKAVRFGFEGDTEEAQKRLIAADWTLANGQTLTVINGYFPQGEARSHEVKFPAKAKFYADLQDLLTTKHDNSQPLVVMGDFNIAPEDTDIGIGPDNAKRWLKAGKASFLPEEREWMQRLKAWGLQDAYRIHHPERADTFSWFDYRSKGFDREPKRGLRIDYLLLTDAMSQLCNASNIDYDIRAMTKPSDHCPVWASFDLEKL